MAAGLLLALAVAPVIFHPALYDDFTLLKQATLLAASALVLLGLAIDGRLLPRDNWLRLAVCAWLAWLTITFLLSLDIRGSVLGYYQYRQGYLTQVAYVVLFLGSLAAAQAGQRRLLLAGGVFGLAGAALYTTIQSVGQDPIDWWIDSSDRAIGTIGNSNELASYAVIAMSGCALATALSPRWRAAVLVAVSAVAAFVVLTAESRSGLIAFGAAVIAMPLFALARKAQREIVARDAAALAAGLALAVSLSFLVGHGFAGTAGRVQTGLQQADIGNSTRLELWRGTWASIVESPLKGYGPDGLHLAFPQNRPSDLGGLFRQYDLTVQSSHNWPLDVAATTGFAGLLLLAALVATATWRSAKRTTILDESLPYIWAAMAGYAVMTMLNPISLAPHAAFFVLLGLVAGSREDVAQPTVPGNAAGHPFRMLAAARLLLVAPACLALVAIAILLPIADLKANAAWEAYAQGDFASAATDYHHAGALIPFERQYASREANAWLAAGAVGPSEGLVQSRKAFVDFNRRFGYSAAEAIGRATAGIGLKEPSQSVVSMVDRAERLNPRGLSMASYASTLRLAASRGGVLRVSEPDHTVYVEPLLELAAR